MRRPTRPWAIGAGLLLALALSCSDEEDSDDPVAPPGPAALAIEAFIGENGERFSRGEADDVRLACDGLLAVELELENWLLRPPGNCGATPQCGHVAVSVGDVLVEAATETVVIPLGDAAPGVHQVRAELRLGDRSAFIGDAGTPVADELEITVSVAACPAAGGAGGSGGAPAMAGAGGSLAGAGGAADQGGAAGAAAGGSAAGSGGSAGDAGGAAGNAGSGGA